MRACGLSRRKTEYLIGIARAAQDGILDFRKMKHLTDEQVIAELVRLRGVGTWTAEMLLIFSLGRRDVLSEKDLGIRNGMKLLYERNELSPEFFEEKRKRYSPYRT